MADLPGDTQATDWSNDGAYADEAQDAAPADVRPSLRAADQGPCLYLGPNGQRCDRWAIEDGFCAIHKPGGIASQVTKPGRVAAALATLVVIVWPYIADLVREIIRWMHSR